MAKQRKKRAYTTRRQPVTIEESEFLRHGSTHENEKNNSLRQEYDLLLLAADQVATHLLSKHDLNPHLRAACAEIKMQVHTKR